MGSGDAQRAASLYREALESDPDEPLLDYKLAKALDKLNDIPGEMAALERAIELNPNLAEAQNQMGYLAARSGDSAQAERFFRATIHASPSYVVAWINLAASLAGQTRWQDAKQAVDRALEIDPDNSEARRLGQAILDAHPST
jgi:superkiller protein 3